MILEENLQRINKAEYPDEHDLAIISELVRALQNLVDLADLEGAIYERNIREAMVETKEQSST